MIAHKTAGHIPYTESNIFLYYKNKQQTPRIHSNKMTRNAKKNIQ